MTRHITWMILSAALIPSCAGWASAAPYTVGNLLVTQNDFLREYTRGGVLVQSIHVPHPENPSEVRQNVAGIVMGLNGQVEIANYAATAHTYLTTYDPLANTWQHVLLPGFQTFGLSNTANGDIARLGNQVFLNAYAFDLSSSSLAFLPNSVFAPNLSLSAISVGQDRLIYAVNAGSPQDYVRVSDPASSYGVVRELHLRDELNHELDIRGLAATADGTIFAADFHGTIYKYSSTGTLLGQFTTGVGELLCLELDNAGTLATATRNGTVVITDTSFGSSFSFSVGAAPAYVNFVTVPEPSSIALAACGATGLLARRYRRRPVTSAHPR